MVKDKKEKQYEIVSENKDERTKVYKLPSGREMPTREPRFMDRDDVYEVIKKAQKNDVFVKKIVENISREKNISIDDVYDLIESGDGLTETEMAAINEATSNTKIDTKDMAILIKSILDLYEKEREEFMEKLSMTDGVHALKIAMNIYNESMVSQGERKK